ncbi:hypothetical protein ACFZB9_05300 [Kitasatospora sp. NPDC008050]|uniref:hypothetical protein n=1 Tax=Kitasatospora sp. NPDC008050 TaxID=3364021 RepID=UPI0036EA89DB
MFERDNTIPSDWKRVHLKGHPPKMMVLSIPILGTRWYNRRWDYWAVRAISLALIGGTAAVQVLMYQSILAYDSHVTEFGAEWWGIITFGAVVTAEGIWVSCVSRRLPLVGLRRRLPKIISYPLDILLSLNFLSFVFLGPGLFLCATIDALRPTPYAERVARRDLAEQLRAHERLSRKR